MVRIIEAAARDVDDWDVKIYVMHKHTTREEFWLMKGLVNEHHSVI